MYLFEAVYINMDNDTERKETIEFDGQFFDAEKECFIYAMSICYNRKKENELVSSLEFIAC